jgi:hypothetical protein
MPAEDDMTPVTPEKDWTDTARDFVQSMRKLSKGDGGAGTGLRLFFSLPGLHLVHRY